ncbi:MAG: hypothetical protein ABIZ82_11440, partial [Candidatus Tumulicola sp.]
LQSMWSEIITTRSGIAALAVDPETKAIIHFGITVFVGDEQADAYQRCEEPLIAQRMIDAWERGGRPFLSAGEIARANAGAGLNLVVAFYGGALTGESPDERMFAANYESSRRVFRGWNLRSYATEVFPLRGHHDDEKWGETLEFRVGRYTPEQLIRNGIPLDQGPCMWMARREDAQTSPSFALTLLFTSYARPRFKFIQQEQDVLALALDGHTDEAIASITHVSVPTVKKRLRDIYAKVVDAAPSTPALAGPLADGVRGVESRRHLLNYLRDHPEELRPYDGRTPIQK